MDPTFVAKIRARRVSLGLPDRSPKICALCVLKAIGLMVGDDDAGAMAWIDTADAVAKMIAARHGFTYATMDADAIRAYGDRRADEAATFAADKILRRRRRKRE